MFNNPFGSFHNTVAEAKEEREQLDRLLTISTPRERLLVAAVALLLVVLTAWLFLGTVPRSVAIGGVLVDPGAGSPGRTRSVQALVRAEHGIALHIAAGMPAVMELAFADGETATLDGEVATIYAVPLSGDLAAFESAAPLSVYRVDIELEEGLDSASIAGTECRIVIELGRQPPVALLRMSRS